MWCAPHSHRHLICLKSQPPSLITMKAKNGCLFLYLLPQWTSRLIQAGIIWLSDQSWSKLSGSVTQLQGGVVDPATSHNSQSLQSSGRKCPHHLYLKFNISRLCLRPDAGDIEMINDSRSAPWEVQDTHHMINGFVSCHELYWTNTVKAS